MKNKTTFGILITVLFLISGISTNTGLSNQSKIDHNNSINSITPNLYDPPYFSALNVKEQMTLSPIFTPDNAIHIYVDWINRANTSIELQNQYITMWDNDVWATDGSPIVIALVAAQNRGVTIRVQVNEIDQDDIASYFDSLGISVRYMGNSTSSGGASYLSDTHNKMLLIDDKISIISSINFSENAFTNNREAGMVIQSSTITLYYKQIFDQDWAVGEIPAISNLNLRQAWFVSSNSHFVSHSNIPKTNFTGVYNVTAFSNPDNADELIFKYLSSAKESIYVSMYTISRPDFNNTLINLKKANPSIDIQVLISKYRVGGASTAENTDTRLAAESLVANGIPVYNSSDIPDTVNNYYHNKYWIIDGKHTFVYSGNWSPRSVTPSKASYTSGEANRDMGIAVHDASDIASFFKSVWDMDVAVGSEWELPLGIKQFSFEEGDVVSGAVDLSAVVTQLPNAALSYQWGDMSSVDVSGSDGFTESFDTTQLPNGITSFTVKAVVNGTEYSDDVEVNIVNYANFENWRFLITEVLPDPSIVSDNDGEFVELTNSFPFDLLLSNWVFGDNGIEYIFNKGFTISAYSSLIIAKNKAGFEGAYGVIADIELGFTLANTQDYVFIKNNRGNYVDVVAYGVAALDGSGQLTAPSAEISIQRSPLHLDTDQASDFVYEAPTPKALVPQITLAPPGSSSSSSSSEEAPANSPLIVSSLLLVLSIQVVVRKKWKR